MADHEWLINVNFARRSTLDLLYKIEMDHQRVLERDAVGWVVACMDTEADPPELPHVVGVYPDEFSAACAATAFDVEDERHGTTGWRHIVCPIFPGERRTDVRPANT